MTRSRICSIRKILIFYIFGFVNGIFFTGAFGAPLATQNVVRLIPITSNTDTANGANIPGNYLGEVISELKKQWPDNRNINIVFHGHSVPSGYFRTPAVNTFESYPFLLLRSLTRRYPTAVINIIKTCKGGENSEQGAKRFKSDVLIHHPDIIFIDYALNDRLIGLARARKAWEYMIKTAVKHGIKVILMTPTPDITESLSDQNAPLAQMARQISELGVKYHVPVIDPYSKFKEIVAAGNSLSYYMAQSNHINQYGHSVVAKLILPLFDITPISSN